MYQGEFTEKELIGCFSDIVGSTDRRLIYDEVLKYTGREIDAIIEKWKSDNGGLADHIYSCKMCGMKPALIEDELYQTHQFVCECGASGSRAETAKEAKAYWNKLAFCPNWNEEK